MRQLKITKSFTNRDIASLDRYLYDIGKEELITEEQELELVRKIKQEDLAALHKLTRANLRFVVSVAKQYQNQGVLLPDLINEGNLGLIKAAQRYDETRGFKFISHAVWWIRQNILLAIAEQSKVSRVPINIFKKARKARRIYGGLEQKYGRSPTEVELILAWTEKDDIKEMDAKEHEIAMNAIEAMQYTWKDESLDKPGTDAHNGEIEITPSDLLVANDRNFDPCAVVDSESLRAELEIALTVLSDRDANIIKMYYGIGHPDENSKASIAKKFNLTEGRVGQIIESSIKELKTKKTMENLRQYLG